MYANGHKQTPISKLHPASIFQPFGAQLPTESLGSKVTRAGSQKKEACICVYVPIYVIYMYMHMCVYVYMYSMLLCTSSKKRIRAIVIVMAST